MREPRDEIEFPEKKTSSQDGSRQAQFVVTGDDRGDSRTDAQIGEIMAADRWIAKVGSRFKKK